ASSGTASPTSSEKALTALSSPCQGRGRPTMMRDDFNLPSVDTYAQRSSAIGSVSDLYRGTRAIVVIPSAKSAKAPIALTTRNAALLFVGGYCRNDTFCPSSSDESA